MSSGGEPPISGPGSVSAPVLGGGPVQVAYGVADVEAAAHRWVRDHGAGPFFVRHHIPVDDVVIHGHPDRFDHSSAYGQWGSVMVELVAVHRPVFLAGPGLHHLAYFVDSFDAAGRELAALGHPAVLTATAGATRFAFHDGGPDLGHLIEVYEPNDGLTGFYAMVADAAVDWDGTNPVRVLG